MPPQAIQLGLFVIEEAIKAEPAIVAELQAMFTKGNPTADDWTALRAKVNAKTYRDYVPKTAIPPGVIL
jgi:hypothetical protein